MVALALKARGSVACSPYLAERSYSSASYGLRGLLVVACMLYLSYWVITQFIARSHAVSCRSESKAAMSWRASYGRSGCLLCTASFGVVLCRVVRGELTKTFWLTPMLMCMSLSHTFLSQYDRAASSSVAAMAIRSGLLPCTSQSPSSGVLMLANGHPILLYSVARINFKIN